MLQISDATLYNANCLDVLASLPSKSVDLILTDPPYGTTACKWDAVIPFEQLWPLLRNVRKDSAATVMTATQPFSSIMGASNVSELKYSWTWLKPHTGQLNAKKMPLKNVEDILVFYKKPPTYNPQFTAGKPYEVRRKGYGGSECYRAQNDHDTISDGRRYPKQSLEFGRDSATLHPTQKPVALMEYLIKTYTNEGDTVLDFTMGSGTTGVACARTGRKFIGIELDETYFNIAAGRILTV